MHQDTTLTGLAEHPSESEPTSPYLQATFSHQFLTNKVKRPLIPGFSALTGMWVAEM